MRARFAGLLMVLLAGAACSGPQADAPRNGIRTVAVSATDAMEFETTEALEFGLGETVRFEVTNVGELRHEFFIGNAEAQRDHAAEMAQMPGVGHDEPTGLIVEPGETGVLEYTFAEPGGLLAGCHEPGHYEAGMLIDLAVS